MADRNMFTTYIIEACPKGYDDEERFYYSAGMGSKWKSSPHQATMYTSRSYAEKRVNSLKKSCNRISLLTYRSTLEQERDMTNEQVANP